jgi:hypothetical protein
VTEFGVEGKRAEAVRGALGTRMRFCPRAGHDRLTSGASASRDRAAKKLSCLVGGKSGLRFAFRARSKAAPAIAFQIRCQQFHALSMTRHSVQRSLHIGRQIDSAAT